MEPAKDLTNLQKPSLKRDRGGGDERDYLSLSDSDGAAGKSHLVVTSGGESAAVLPGMGMRCRYAVPDCPDITDTVVILVPVPVSVEPW
jgi:hypothetical protein